MSKTVAEKQLLGTFRPGRDGNKIASVSVTAIPEPPAMLGDYGSEQWYSIMKYATQIKGYLAPPEISLVESACMFWQVYKTAAAIAGTEEPDDERKEVGVYLRRMKIAYEMYRRAMLDLGLTPTVRSKVTQIDTNQNENEFELED
jgi:phage terminase small subunit